MKFSFARRDPQSEFWATFAEVAPRISAAGQPTRCDIAALAKGIRRIHRDLVFQLGQVDGVWQIEISGDGLRSMLPVVQQTVRAAPAVPGWRVVAFRQRTPGVAAVERGGIRLAPDEVRFTARRGADGIYPTIYLPGLTEKNQETMAGLIFLLLDSVVGEFDMMTKIRRLEFRPLPAESGAGFRPLMELRDEVDDFAGTASRGG